MTWFKKFFNSIGVNIEEPKNNTNSNFYYIKKIETENCEIYESFPMNYKETFITPNVSIETFEKKWVVKYYYVYTKDNWKFRTSNIKISYCENKEQALIKAKEFMKISTLSDIEKINDYYKNHIQNECKYIN